MSTVKMNIVITIPIEVDAEAYADCDTIQDMCLAEQASWSSNNLEDMVSGYTQNYSVKVIPAQ